MKTIATLLSLFVLLSLNAMLFAQSPEQKQVHIKVKKEVNGVETTLDTVISADENMEINQVLKDLGVDADVQMNGENSFMFKQGDHPEDGEMKVKVMKWDSEDGEMPSLEGMDEETRALIEKHMKEGKAHGKMVFINKSGESTTLDGANTFEWKEGEGGEDAKVYQIRVDAEDMGDGEHKVMKITGDMGDFNLEVPADGDVKVIKMEGGEALKWEELDDETRQKLEELGINPDDTGNFHQLGHDQDAKVIIHKEMKVDGEGEHPKVMMFHSNGETVGDLEDMKVTVEMIDEESEDGKIIKKQMVHVAIFLQDLEEGDVQVLERSGVSHNNLENSLSMEQLSFYPNPNNGRFNLSFESQDQGDVNITVVNAEGRKVYEENISDFSGRYEKEIDLTGNASGVYFLNLRQNGKILNKKLVLN